MDDLRGKIAEIVESYDGLPYLASFAADTILAIPEIADALQVKANLSDIISDAVRDVEDRD